MAAQDERKPDELRLRGAEVRPGARALHESQHLLGVRVGNVARARQEGGVILTVAFCPPSSVMVKWSASPAPYRLPLAGVS